MRIPSGCAVSAIFSKSGERRSGEDIIKSIALMHDRSNGLGGGFAAYGIYPEYKNLYALRLKVKAGLTGYAQVYGKYNTTAYDKLKLDLMYIRKYFIMLDLKLILMTPKIMFLKESTEGVMPDPDMPSEEQSEQGN